MDNARKRISLYTLVLVLLFQPFVVWSDDSGTFLSGARTDFALTRDVARDIAIQVDGKIVVVGFADDIGIGPGSSTAVARYERNLSRDQTFGIFGIKRVPELFASKAIAIQADGKILLSGRENIVRLLTNGQLDTTFSSDGVASTPGNDLAIQGNGRILSVCCGEHTRSWTVSRTLSDGKLDLSFGNLGIVSLGLTEFGLQSPGFLEGISVASRPDGKIVTLGRYYGSLGSVAYRVALARLNEDGSFDTTFGNDGTVLLEYVPANEFFQVREVKALALQPDGKILVGATVLGSDFDFMVARFLEDGSLDSNFGTPFSPIAREGFAVAGFADSDDPSFLSDIAVQDDGEIVAVGTTNFDTIGPCLFCVRRFSIVRFRSNGQLDRGFLFPDGSFNPGFGNEGKVISDFGDKASATSVAIRFDRLYVAGSIGARLPDGSGAENIDFSLAQYLAFGEIGSGIGSTQQYITSVGCPDDLTVGNSLGQCGASVSYSEPTSSDQGTVTCAPVPGSFFDVGTTDTTCTSVVGDGTQNQQRTASCSLSVTVNDTEAPGVTCPEISILIEPGQCSAATDLMVTSGDNCAGSQAPVTTPPDGSIFALGTTSYTASATDASGNVASCSSTVTVVDDTPPEIQCNTEGVFVRPGVPVSFQATATDSCSVASVVATSFDCWKFNKAGKRVDKTNKCSVALSGADINIIEPSGVGTIIGWTVEAADGSGNVATTSCQVVSQDPRTAPD